MSRPKKIKAPPRISFQQTVDSVMVHDMKNLAFRLSSLLQNMEEHYDNPVFRKSMEEIIGNTVEQMQSFVQRFRDRQQDVIVKLKVDLNQILQELMSGIPERVKRMISVETSFQAIPMIWGDPFYLHNAFQSLIQNAIDAMPDGGTLKIQSGIIQNRKKQKLCVEISDTGIGMTESFLEDRIFAPFESTKHHGLGLGLYTSRQIFLLHQGRIEVKSAPQTGTTFRILFPLENDAT